MTIIKTLINKAVDLALNYKPYELGGRNLECSKNVTAKYRTAIPGFKLRDMCHLIMSKQHIQGPLIEIGVWRGGVGLLLATLITDKLIYLVDTFEGLPIITERDSYHKLRDFDDCSFEEVKGIFTELELNNVEVIKAWFPREVEKRFDDMSFSIVHLDVDVYESYKESLEFLYPKLSPGGIIILDDYAETSCSGATAAVDEFTNKVKILGSLYYIEKE